MSQNRRFGLSPFLSVGIISLCRYWYVGFANLDPLKKNERIVLLSNLHRTQIHAKMFSSLK